MLNLFIVIPCYNEPDILTTVNSLASCTPIGTSVQVVVVLNSSANDSKNVIERNVATKSQLEEWTKTAPEWLQLTVLWVDNVHPKIAGVGNARKIGMDYCIEQLTNPNNSILVCFDADCTCSENYLIDIERSFREQCLDAATIYYEHQIINSSDPIVPYELFLRYHYQGLKYAGYPYAYQTIGSSMAVKADTYKSFGGMNQRKAGEDFYFLHKIIPYRNVGEINTCAVCPSARSSDRVPFGTGHAVEKAMTSSCKTYYTYSSEIYYDIKMLVEWIRNLELNQPFDGHKLPKEILTFLIQENVEQVFTQFQKQAKTNEQLITFIFRWLNGFRMLKLVHFLRDTVYTNVDINHAASNLWAMLCKENKTQDNVDWLRAYRSLEKGF